jgi:hypothetical protein
MRVSTNASNAGQDEISVVADVYLIFSDGMICATRHAVYVS